jgi:hypothetical protein
LAAGAGPAAGDGANGRFPFGSDTACDDAVADAVRRALNWASAPLRAGALRPLSVELASVDPASPRGADAPAVRVSSALLDPMRMMKSERPRRGERWNARRRHARTLVIVA